MTDNIPLGLNFSNGTANGDYWLQCQPLGASPSGGAAAQALAKKAASGS